MDFSTDSIMLAFAAFLLGVIIGIFLPFLCIKFYNLVGIHLGDMIEDDETDAGKENVNNDR